MFGNTVEKRIVREADKVASLIEDLDALSWNRVLEIGKYLQSEANDSRYVEAGGELVAIAWSNLSIASRLGFQPVSPDTRLTSAGMEITDNKTLEKMNAEDASPDTLADVPVDAPADAKDASLALEIPLDDPFEAMEDLLDDAFGEQETSSERSMGEQEPVQPLSPPVETSEATPTCDDVEPSPPTKQDVSKSNFSRFRNLYASRDGGLSVFEDENGHLVAVDSSRLV